MKKSYFKKWLTVIEKTVKPRFVELNKTAFDLSYNN